MGYNAFGYLYAWSKIYKDILIYSTTELVLVTKLDSSVQNKSFSDNFLISTHLTAFMDSEPTTDTGDAPIPVLVRKLGRLNPGEMYGYFPAIALGGQFDIDNMRKVRALEHHAFLASIGRFTLIRYENPQPGAPLGSQVPMRKIGKSRA